MSEFREGSVISGAYIMKDVRVATASNGNPFTSPVQDMGRTSF